MSNILKCQYVIATLIGNISSCNWEYILRTLDKIPNFHRQIFQKIQPVVTFNSIGCHESLELLLELHA